ncbi:hypothetical protein E4K67_01535 [Desulfosporosinus fructosivorans]|uniref:Uncharacterized protein n=1 Tax=Desulfosporosinus fructosivorans TaxID=2018669 RepID=A0A4Z0RDU5_9FIRM|nr:hypothetical protein [Desulfosporosinus fructosivorans]TGE39706.1 hypothetical protein E4K67_01535 [Desulfosporosinus fructosivorans]
MATTTAKASERVIADPLGWETRGKETQHNTACFPRCGKRGIHPWTLLTIGRRHTFGEVV